MKVKIGDKLKVKNDLELGQEFGVVHVISEMLEMAGQEVTVSYIDPNYIHVKEDEDYWYWDLNMFDKICKDCGSKISDCVAVWKDQRKCCPDCKCTVD